MPEHMIISIRGRQECALRSLFGDSLAPGARAGWPSSLEGGRHPRGEGKVPQVASRGALCFR